MLGSKVPSAAKFQGTEISMETVFANFLWTEALAFLILPGKCKIEVPQISRGRSGQSAKVWHRIENRISTFGLSCPDVFLSGGLVLAVPMLLDQNSNWREQV